MKNKEYCLPCEIKGIKKLAKHELYVDAIGEITYVCDKHLHEYVEENVKLGDSLSIFEDD